MIHNDSLIDRSINATVQPTTGARVMWGGQLLKGHRIPDCYGAWEPTAVYVPLEVIIEEGWMESVYIYK